MGNHKEWRKIAKRERRRKIRKQLAVERDKIYDDEEYMKEMQLLHEMEMEQIERTNAEENEKWLRAERVAIEQWQKLQERMRILQQEKFEQEARIKLEYELEQKRLQEEAEKLKAIEEENKLKHERFMKSLEEFLSGDITEPPSELLVYRETRSNAEPCPFFTKTACCRFGDQCSRNHQYPGISKVLLATNFYVHFGLNNSTQNEYDTDIMLEYEDSETLKEFKEFFYDVLTEFEKFDILSDEQLKVCNNHEKHLRGNTYIEYAELRCAVAAYRGLHTRWYGGRQLSLQFCNIHSWKNAICGLQLKRRCPKGRACNFLHVFRNPNNLFSGFNSYRGSGSQRSAHTEHRGRSPHRRSPLRTWRWSESPEVEISSKSRRRSSSPRRHQQKERNRSDDNRRKSRIRRSTRK